MAIPRLYGHPFSSYCQKVLIALYENGVPFEWRLLAGDPESAAELAALWPLKKMPVLADGNRTIIEASIIVEYVDIHYPGPVRMVPADARAALPVRWIDRFFDNYIMTPMQKIVGDALREQGQGDPRGVSDARDLLDAAYAWLERYLADRQWADSSGFSLADCAAAPALFYADWAHPLGARFPAVRAYRERLLGRASFARAVDEARPYRHFFPLGAPDRD